MVLTFKNLQTGEFRTVRGVLGFYYDVFFDSSQDNYVDVFRVLCSDCYHLIPMSEWGLSSCQSR